MPWLYFKINNSDFTINLGTASICVCIQECVCVSVKILVFRQRDPHYWSVAFWAPVKQRLLDSTGYGESNLVWTKLSLFWNNDCGLWKECHFYSCPLYSKPETAVRRKWQDLITLERFISNPYSFGQQILHQTFSLRSFLPSTPGQGMKTFFFLSGSHNSGNGGS